MNMIDDCNEEVNKYLKEREENTNKSLMEINKFLETNQKSQEKQSSRKLTKVLRT